MNGTAILAICGALLSCWASAVLMEMVFKYDKEAGNLETFSQFLFISIYGLVFTSKFFSVERKIPMREYASLVLLMFTSNITSNYAFSFNISMPLSLIFKSSSLMANLVLGMIILKRRYETSKYISVILITIGIIVCTFESGTHLEKKRNENVVKDVKDETETFFWWCFGVFLMTVSLFLAARMGLYQEMLYKRCGKHPDEALFYTHLIPMPGFLLMAPNIYKHFIVLLNSPTFQIPIIGYHIPLLMCTYAGTILFHFMCIKSVYVLTTECTSLTVTLVVTIRKFVSLTFSVFYFNNIFTMNHWIGTGLVFVGTVMFTELIQRLMAKKSIEHEPLLVTYNEPEPLNLKQIRKTLLKKFTPKVHLRRTCRIQTADC